MQPHTDCASVTTVLVVVDDIPLRQWILALVHDAGCRPEAFASVDDVLTRRPGGPMCLILHLVVMTSRALLLVRRIAGDRPDMPVIVLTGRAAIRDAVMAIQAGSFEFLTSPLSHNSLLSAIRNASERSRSELMADAERCVLRGRHAALSHRERDVMERVVTGRMNKQISFELGISVVTVKAHRGRVMRKMHANSLADLVRMALRLGGPRAEYHTRSSDVERHEASRRLTAGARG